MERKEEERRRVRPMVSSIESRRWSMEMKTGIFYMKTKARRYQHRNVVGK